MSIIDPFDKTRIGSILDDLKQAATDANKEFEEEEKGNFYASPAWVIEVAFLKLLAATEALGLTELKKLVIEDMQAAKANKNGFAASESDPIGENYPIYVARHRQYIKAIETLGGIEAEHNVTKDLKQILRATEYPITDKSLFGSVPKSENDVHTRIEGVLRCVFPDLKRKPQLTKPIKNFEPDTGLPSIQTLIEYKFISKPKDVPTIADQILADTRAYNSKDWTTFVYVIYETTRLKPEVEWNLLLQECGVPTSTSVIVLSGEPAPIEKRQGNVKSKRNI